jgi:fucose permease
MTEIVNLVAMLTIFGAGAAVGVLLTVQLLRHNQAELQAEKDQFAEMRELFAAQNGVRVGSRGGLGPSGVDPRDQLPI